MTSPGPSAVPSPTATVVSVHSTLDAEIKRDELRIEEYGGDDPEDPPRKVHSGEKDASALSSEAQADPNLVTWDGPNDPSNPQNWNHRYRWFATILCSLLTLNVTFASSAPSTATPFIAAHFRVSEEVATLTTSLFLLGYVFGPVFWGPGSELLGRRPVLVLAMTLYTIMHIGQADAHNIATLLVSRFLGGFFACAPLTISGGIIADIWDPVTRGPATSMFATTVFLGPVFGPLVSGYIVTSSLGWRWVFWVMMIFAGVCTIFGILFFPETYAPVILSRKAKELRKADPEKNKEVFAESEKQEWSARELFNRTILRPFTMLFVEPILLLVTVYLSVVYGLIYAMFEVVPIVFLGNKGLTITQTGLVFIAVGLGSLFGSLANLYLLRPYPQLMKQWRGFPPAEKRLYGAMFGGPILVIAIFWLGFTGAYASVPWYVPALGLVLLGMGITLVFISFLSYLVDTYLMYSASAFAANTIIRSAVGAAFPLFTVQMFNSLGIQWAATLIGCVALLLAPMPFLFYKYGPRIRSNSKFAPCIDLKIAKVLEEEKNAEREKGQV